MHEEIRNTAPQKQHNSYVEGKAPGEEGCTAKSEKQKETGMGPLKTQVKDLLNVDLKNISIEREVFGFHDSSSLASQGFSLSILSGQPLVIKAFLASLTFTQ